MTRALALTAARLRRMPLPKPDDDGDKEHHGRVLVSGWSAQVPGALLLSGVAALRAGAGKLQLATVASVAPALGVAVPESMVIALPESRQGEIVGSRAPSCASTPRVPMRCSSGPGCRVNERRTR